MSATPRRTGRVAAMTLVTVLAPLAVLASVWLPVILHYRVTTPEITPETVARLRVEPDETVLARVDAARYGMVPPEGDGQRARADEVLAGRYRTRTGEVVPVALAPTGDLISSGSPMAQLQVSSLAVTQVLLDAWRRTGEPRYLDAALESATGWARFERSAWLPVGFLWNDHAIAARVVVLADLWREYRRREDFDPARGAELLAFVARSAALLARDSHYTARTNHGIMQNLALLHVATVFPGLPGTAGHVRLATERLALQLPYYVSPDGVVLEHSAGYQDFALRLLRSAFEYARILDVAPPAELERRYAEALCFRRHFTRPDGTVPSYGDSFTIRPEPPGDLDDAVCDEHGPVRVDQDFGYASLHGVPGAGDRMFVTWADFPARAHKHDDELAAWLWFDGRDWWAGSGYWPYGDPARRAAVSWRGANAPHAVGEPGGRERSSRLLASHLGPPVTFLDLERRAHDGSVYRRQLASLGDAGVLVLDSSAAPAGAPRLETVWTLAPGVAVRPAAGVANELELIHVPSGGTLRASFFGTDGHALERMRGSRDPFGGLVALDGQLHAVEAVIATAPAGGWAGALWRSPGAGGAGPVTAGWDEPEHWSVSLANAQSLRRDGPRLAWRTTDGADVSLPLTAGATERPALDAAAARYREMAARYPVFRDHYPYRVRVTLGLGALFVAQFAGLWLLARIGVGPVLRLALVLAGWSVTGWWLYDRYLV
jgi:hypothetical protein